MAMKGHLTPGGEHTMQYADDCTLEIYIIVLTNVILIN